MARRRLLLLAPLFAVLVLGGWMLLSPRVIRGAENRITAPAVAALERKLGKHIYAPTWMPQEGNVGTSGVLEGQYRILQDYDTPDGRLLVMLAQETRNEDRDRYHDRIFLQKPEAKSDVNGTPGYLVTGSNGERRLFWNRPDTALILSSSRLSDEEMVRIAQSVR